MSAGPRATAVAALVAAALAGCPRAKEDAKAGLGRPVFAGPVRALAASPDGAWIAFLDGCADVRGQALPPGTASCDLHVVAAAGGAAPRRIARAVTTLPHAVDWTSSGRLVALAGYDVPTGSGALVLWEGGEPRTLAASGVTFHGVGPHGEVGWVERGRLRVLLAGEGEPREVSGADAVASFDLSPADPEGCGAGTVRLLARRSYAAGGQLLAAGCALDPARTLERGQVGEYRFARGSAGFAYTVQGQGGAELKVVRAGSPPAAVGRGAQAFAFGPDGAALAFVGDVAPGKQGNLYLAAPGRPAALLAREVGELRWAARAPRLAWLERYEPRVRSGTLGAGGPGLAPRTVAPNVSDLEISADGEHLAFLQHTTRGGYSVDLALAHVSAPKDAKPAAIAQGVFGFAFSPDGAWLYYRTRCVRNAEACDLERVPAAGPAPGAAPERIADGVKSFEFDPRDPGRLLVTWQRMDLVALDLGVWERGRLVAVDTAAVPGSARFLGPDSRRLAYAVAHPKRHGVYVAELPR